jgi:uncharacterized protein (AIM24 family)
MNVPQPVPAQTQNESWAGVTYHISGELVPQLQVELGGTTVFFEHHVLLWKLPDVKIELRKIAGGVKRKIAGGDFFVTRAVGQGRVAFSRDAPGQMLAHHLRHGEGIDVREHQFIAATDDLEFTFERVQGIRNMLLGGSGFFIDKFRATEGDAIVWIHGNGNVMQVTLDDGEQIDVEPGGWLYKDPSVKLESHSAGLTAGLFGGGEKLTWNRFTGPGRVGIQTMFIDPAEARVDDQSAVQGAGAASMLRGLMQQ